MRKIMSLIAAAALTASCFSCSEKKKTEKEPVNVENTAEEPALDEPVKQEYREFSEDSFTTLDVTLRVTDDEPPLKVHSINVSELDFGEYIPPCKAEEYRDRYRTYYSNIGDEEYREKAEKEWEKSCTEPHKGDVYDIIVDGNDLYMTVRYDTMCTDVHETAIFRVNGLTGEQEELFRHSAPESSLYLNEMYMIKGVLYVNTKERGLCYLDEEKSELVTILPSPDEVKSYTGILPNSADRLLIREVVNITEEVPEDYKPQNGQNSYSNDGEHYYIITGSDIAVKEYDFESKTWNVLYTAHKESENADDDCPYIFGELFAWKEKPENSRKYDVCTENYRVSTGLTGCEIIYADDKKLVVKLGSASTTSDTKIVHVYDLENSMHYVIDYDGLGAKNCKSAGDGLVIFPAGMTGTVYYIIPELGLTFPLNKFNDGETDFELGGWMGIDSSNDNKALTYDINVRVGEHKVTDEMGNEFTEYEYERYRYWYTEEGSDE